MAVELLAGYGVILLVVTVIFGLLPLRCKSIARHKLMIAMANSFSSGLFLAVGLLHILPEAQASFKDRFPSGTNKEFPWTFMICIIVYELVLYLEKVSINAHELLDHDHEHGPDLKELEGTMTPQKGQKQNSGVFF